MVDKALAAVEAVFSASGAILTMLISFAVLCDVAFRYVFNRPFAGLYELILISMVIIVYSGISNAQRLGDNIRIELVSAERFPVWDRISRILGFVLGIAVSVIVAYSSGTRAFKAFSGNDVTGGVVPWPLWPAKFALTLGFSLLALRLVTQLVSLLREDPHEH